jgi:starvation-inducible DNA-binding protein
MTDPNTNSKAALIAELNGLLADHFALFVKAKNFHWHVKGPRFRDLHLLFDEQAIEVRDQIDLIGERVRKLSGDAITSVGAIASHSRIKDQPRADLTAEEMIAELRDDNAGLVDRLKSLKELTGQVGDNATDGLIDGWTDMAEQRVWFLNSVLG